MLQMERVIVHHVHDHAKPSLVQRLHSLLQLPDALLAVIGIT